MASIPLRLSLPSHSLWWRLLLVALPHLPRTPPSHHLAVYLIPSLPIWSPLSLTLQFHILPSLWPLSLFMLFALWSLRSKKRWWSVFRGYYGVYRPLSLPLALARELNYGLSSIIPGLSCIVNASGFCNMCFFLQRRGRKPCAQGTTLCLVSTLRPVQQLKGNPTRSQDSSDIALGFIGTRKLPHHNKVVTPLGAESLVVVLIQTFCNSVTIFRQRSFCCFWTALADFWSLSGEVIPMGFCVSVPVSVGVSWWCWIAEYMNDEIV